MHCQPMREVELIKQRLSITDIVQSYVPIEKVGSRFRIKCPFHNEKTASLYLSPERGSYYCFGCGVRGDIFTFVEHFEGLDFRGTLKLLAERAGVPLSNNPEQTQTSVLYKVLEAATVFFQAEYTRATNARAYVTKRTVTEATATTFRLGFAPDNWHTLSEYLHDKGFSDAVIAEAGLTKQNEDGKVYDRFRNRIMFPITDSGGRTIGFTGRALVEDTHTPKYLNSPETPLFSKRSVLFGLSQAKDAIRKKNYTIVVEGQFDALLAHQAGTDNTVAGSGTAFTDETETDSKVTHLGLVERISRNIVLAYDTDGAGEKALIRTSVIAYSLGMEVKVVTVPYGKDPADCIAHDPKLWLDALKKTEPVLDILARRILSRTTDTRARIEAIHTMCFPIIAVVPRALDQDRLLARLADTTLFDQHSLSADFRGSILSKQKTVPVNAPTATNRTDFSAREYVGGILALHARGTCLLPESFMETLTNEIPKDAQTILLTQSQQNEALLFTVERLLDNKKAFTSVLDDLLTGLKLEKIEYDMRMVSHALKVAPDPAERSLLLTKHQALSVARQELINRRLVK